MLTIVIRMPIVNGFDYLYLFCKKSLKAHWQYYPVALILSLFCREVLTSTAVHIYMKQGLCR